MKRLLSFTILISAVGFFNPACEEDMNPNYPFTIIVKSFEDSLRAPNVRVEVNTPIPDNSVRMEKFTDVNGEAKFEYGQNAVLEVRASRGSKSDYRWLGCADVRLQANERVTKTVYIKDTQKQEVEGCLTPR